MSDGVGAGIQTFRLLSSTHWAPGSVTCDMKLRKKMYRVYFLEESLYSWGQLMVARIGHLAGDCCYVSTGEGARLPA